MHQLLRSRFRRWFFRGFSFYTICIGINGYLYDNVTNTYRQTRITRAIALLVNLVTLLLLPLSEFQTLKQFIYYTDEYGENPIIVFCNCAFIVVHALAVLYTVFSRCARERASHRIATQLCQLGERFLARVPINAAVQADFNQVLKYKIVSFLSLACCELIVQVGIMIDYKWFSWLQVVFVALSMHIIYGTILIFFWNMWLVGHTLYQLNEQLHRLMDEMAAFSNDSQDEQCRQLGSRLAQLIDAYWKCSEMAESLHNIYSIQMLGLRFGNFVMTIIMGYWASLFVFLGYHEWRFIVFGSMGYINITFDLYMNDLLNDMTVRGHQKTIQILKRCNGFHLSCPTLNKMCEEFALRLSTFQLRLNACGLFMVDKRLCFSMLASAVSYIIVLVQFHLVLERVQT